MNSQPLDYESDSLTIRPRLGHKVFEVWSLHDRNTHYVPEVRFHGTVTLGCGGLLEVVVERATSALSLERSVILQVSDILCVREYSQLLSLHSVKHLLVVGVLSCETAGRRLFTCSASVISRFWLLFQHPADLQLRQSTFGVRRPDSVFGSLRHNLSTDFRLKHTYGY